ncbi:MAG: GTPase HflX [candidate division NC10 bacterium]|nr:GTPase HflX [candidate division NC10 bacterium]
MRIIPADGQRRREVAVLVGLRTGRAPRWVAEDSLEELARLAESAGASPRHTILQERPAPDPRTLIGAGKVEELRTLCRGGVDLVIVDEDLSGSQQRNLERELGCKVIDRAGLILDIFAQRAMTREGKLQVELAQLQYLLPRLTRRWTHLERLGGGIGTRGPGETQLESDRRRLRVRMARIRRDLRKVRRHRGVLRRPRQKVPIPTLALVGYTNAGKSSLLNALTHASVYVADKLFATLDPTLRKVQLPSGRPALLSDTVGLIRKLPPQLVQAFKATLEEVQEADALVHVIDASHPQAAEQRAVVERVLEELGVAGKPVLAVHNKIDLLPEAAAAALTRQEGPVAISALTGQGLPALRKALDALLDATGIASPVSRSEAVAQERGQR